MKECNCHRGPEVGKKVVGCPPKVININHPAEPVLFHRVDIPAAMGDDTTYPPTNGLYRNILLHYEANSHTYIYSSDGIPTLIEADVPQEVWDDIDELKDDLAAEVRTRGEDDAILQGNINAVAQDLEDFKNSPDVVDIVATYADLEAYDTSHLGDKDVIRVLADETHDGESSYYRWGKTTETWTFIGATGPYYTKSQVDTALGNKLDKTTTFWGQTVNNGAVNGEIVFEGNLSTTGKGVKPVSNGIQMWGGQAVISLHGTNALDGVADFNMATIKNITDGSADTDAVNVRQLATKQNALTFDDTPTTSSNNPVKSGGIKSYVDGKIGDVKILTNEDKNYPENNPTKVAAWLLDPGVYVAPEGLTVAGDATAMSGMVNGVTLIVSPENTSGKKPILMISHKSDDSMFPGAARSELVDVATGAFSSTENYLADKNVIDNLSSAQTALPLSANQGRLLDEKTTPASGGVAPTSAQIGILGKVYIDTTTNDAYMCTKVDNGTYTWVEITQTMISAPDWTALWS